MSEPEKIDLKQYFGEKFDEMSDKFDGLSEEVSALRTEVGELKTDKNRRDGRDNFITKFAKAFATAVVTVGAAIAAYLGLKPN